MKLRICFAVLLLALAASSCTKNDEPQSTKVTISVYATLSECHVANDNTDHPLFSDSSTATLAVAGKQQSYEENPLDVESGMFIFRDVEGPLKQSNTLLMYTCTGDASAEYDGKLKYSVPSVQSGDLTSHLCSARNPTKPVAGSPSRRAAA